MNIKTNTQRTQPAIDGHCENCDGEVAQSRPGLQGHGWLCDDCYKTAVTEWFGYESIADFESDPLNV